MLQSILVVASCATNNGTSQANQAPYTYVDGFWLILGDFTTWSYGSTIHKIEYSVYTTLIHPLIQGFSKKNLVVATSVEFYSSTLITDTA